MALEREVAAAGDAVASGIAARGCDELARCVEVVHDRLFGGEAAPVFVIGGLSRSDLWMNGFRAAVVRRALTLAGAAPSAAVDAALAAGRAQLPASF